MDMVINYIPVSIAKNKIANKYPCILIKNWDRTIFSGLPVLFLYALARGAQLSLKIILSWNPFHIVSEWVLVWQSN